MVSSIGLNRERGQFLNFFLGAPMVYNAKKCIISRLMRVCVGLTMLTACTFLASYWSAIFGRFLQVSALASHWLADCTNYTPTPGDNNKYSAN
jgi:hypothetical protein